jgi:hypothetical protein
MARLKPDSVDALRHVYGVGARKADDLGGAFLAVIHPAVNAVSPPPNP